MTYQRIFTPKDIHNIFPQQTFQTIITGGKISTAVKNGDALTIQLLLFVSYRRPR